MNVTGTLIWYYCICKREVWLMAHQIVPDQNHEDIDFGRFLHEKTYQRKQKEIIFGNIRFDVLLDNGEELVIGETKKSSKYQEASKWQMMFYLQTLKKAGIKVSGELLYPKERKREKVELDIENEKILDTMKEEIIQIAEATLPMSAHACKYCKKCGYEEYCWS